MNERLASTILTVIPGLVLAFLGELIFLHSLPAATVRNDQNLRRKAGTCFATFCFNLARRWSLRVEHPFGCPHRGPEQALGARSRQFPPH